MALDPDLKSRLGDLMALMKLAGGETDWPYAAAIAAHESSLNPWAVGDSGEAWGLWQMHRDFVAWLWPNWASEGSILYVANGNPFLEALTFNRFWAVSKSLAPNMRIRLFASADPSYRVAHPEKLLDHSLDAY